MNLIDAAVTDGMVTSPISRSRFRAPRPARTGC